MKRQLIVLFSMVMISCKPALGDFIEEAKLTASDGVAGATFGRSISIYGDYALVGAHGDDDKGKWSGSVYIFKRENSTWVEDAKLCASDGSAEDFFGVSVSMSGDYAIVGSSGDDDLGPHSGSAYVFQCAGGNWVEQAKLTASDGTRSDSFGWCVSISGDYAMVGSYWDDNNGLRFGSAYIFKREAGNWIEQVKLGASDAEDYDHFGVSVCIDGDYGVVGSYGDDDLGFNSGAAYIFKREGGDWIEQAKLTASDGGHYGYFGSKVSMSGDYVIVASNGAAYIFKRDGAEWTEQAKLTAWGCELASSFGEDVCISGDYCIVGGYVHSPDIGSDCDAGYIYKREGTSWQPEGKVSASDIAPLDWFGYSVCISDEYCLVGAILDDDKGSESGSVYSFLPLPVLDVSVDIEPGSCPNPLNVKSKGVLPVAILGSEDVDVNAIDVASVRLGGVGPIRSSVEDVETPVEDGNECECNSVGPDSYMDLTLKFEIEEIVEAIGEVNDGDVLSMGLTGVLEDETPIEGSDCIVVIGKVPRWMKAKKSDVNEDGVIDLQDFCLIAEFWLEASAE